MAAGDIAQHYIQKFAADVVHLAQQKKSRLRNTVREQFDVANKFTFNVTSPRGAMTSRATASSSTAGFNGYKRTATQFVDQVYNNRVVLPLEYVAADSFGEADIKRRIESPQTTLAEAFARQVGRTWDDIIIAAWFAAALDSLANSNAHPAGSQIGGATTAPSLDLVIQARELLAESDVDPDEEKFLVVSPNFITALLNDAKLPSGDYSTVRALQEGKVDKFCGFSFIESTRLTTPGGTPKQIYGAAYTKDAMGLAVNTEGKVDIGKDPGLSFDTVVQVAIDAGAVRIQDAKVLRIHYLESN